MPSRPGAQQTRGDLPLAADFNAPELPRACCDYCLCMAQPGTPFRHRVGICNRTFSATTSHNVLDFLFSNPRDGETGFVAAFKVTIHCFSACPCRVPSHYYVRLGEPDSTLSTGILRYLARASVPVALWSFRQSEAIYILMNVSLYSHEAGLQSRMLCSDLFDL